MFKKTKNLKTSNKSFKFSKKTSKPKQMKQTTMKGKPKQRKQEKLTGKPKQPMTQAHKIGPHKRQDYLTAKPKQPKFFSDEAFTKRLRRATT